MIRLSNSKFISIFTKLLILLVAAKAVSLLVWLSFPSDGVELKVKENYQPKYQRVDLKSMITKSKTKNEKKVKQKVDSGVSITNMILKGLYGTQTKGFIIVAMKSTPNKTSIIEVGESFEGYVLEAIFPRSVRFHKDGSDFMLHLEKIEEPSAVPKVNKKNIPTGTSAQIFRKDIAFYAKNPNQIWKEISIKEIRDGKKIKGFKVTKIDPYSRFASLGLKKGDLIVNANNIKLNSYREALQIYENIDKLDVIQIVVMRNNQEVELIYEIN